MTVARLDAGEVGGRAERVGCGLGFAREGLPHGTLSAFTGGIPPRHQLAGWVGSWTLEHQALLVEHEASAIEQLAHLDPAVGIGTTARARGKLQALARERDRVVETDDT